MELHQIDIDELERIATQPCSSKFEDDCPSCQAHLQLVYLREMKEKESNANTH